MSKFLIKQTKTGFKFDFFSSTGDVLGRSYVYASKNDCVNAINILKNIARDADYEYHGDKDYRQATSPKYEVYKDKAGKFRYRLKTEDDKIILASVPFETKHDCDVSVGHTRDNAPAASVED